MALTGLTSDTNDLWKYFLQNGQLPQGGQQAFPMGKDIDISQLPPELQKVVKAKPNDFSEGNADKIDTEGEVRKLMEHVIGQEGQGMPNAPGMEALQGLSKDDMMALLIDWVMNKQQEQRAGGGQPQGGQDRGNMGGQNFARTQPASFGGGGNHGGGGSTGGGGGGPSASSGGGGTSNVNAPASPTQTKDLKGNTNAERAFNYFVDKGLTKEQAAGIVGNLQAESGVQPGRHQDGGPAFGIAQWEGGRQDNLRAFAAQQGKPVDDMGMQLDFLWQELQGPEKAAFNALKGATTARDAAVIFEEKFERAGIPNLPARISAANSAMEAFA